MATKAIPVVAAKVASTQTNFPVYIKPSAMTGWTTLTTAEANSIRFYSDSGLTTELAREVVSADEIHVKVPSLTTTTTIYADYDGVRSDYAVTDTYGRNAVWSDYDHVWHLGNAVDSAGNAATGTTAGVTFGSQQIGDGATFSASTGITISSGMINTNNASTLTLQTWAKTSTDNVWMFAHQNNTNARSQKDLIIFGGDFAYFMNPTNSGSNQLYVEQASETYLDNAWHMLHATYGGGSSASNVSLYKDGVNYAATILNDTLSTNPPTNVPGFIGSRGAFGSALTGSLDEMRIHKEVLSANWITTEYNNQSDVAAFWGAVTDVAAGNPTGFFAFF